MPEHDFGVELGNLGLQTVEKKNSRNDELINSSGGSYVRVNSVYGGSGVHDDKVVENNTAADLFE